MTPKKWKLFSEENRMKKNGKTYPDKFMIQLKIITQIQVMQTNSLMNIKKDRNKNPEKQK